MLKAQPGNAVIREALVIALADIGEPDRGRTFLDSWPKSTRDARYWRLRGRWDLEYDHQYEAAVNAFRKALIDLPHDWKTRIRLARAYKTSASSPKPAPRPKPCRDSASCSTPPPLAPDSPPISTPPATTKMTPKPPPTSPTSAPAPA